MFLSVGTFAIGTVKPLFKDRAVALMGGTKGGHELIVVFGGAVGRVVAIPWGYIYTKSKGSFMAGFAQLLQYVALSISPLALCYSVLAVGIGPQAESVVMLGGKDNALHACLSSHLDPLTTVEVGGGKEVFGFGAVAPFVTSKGVGTKMAEHVHLHLLPLHLCLRRERPVGEWCLGVAAIKNE